MSAVPTALESITTRLKLFKGLHLHQLLLVWDMDCRRPARFHRCRISPQLVPVLRGLLQRLSLRRMKAPLPRFAHGFQTNDFPCRLPVVKNSAGRRALNSWPSRTPLVNIENTPGMRGRHVSAGPSALAENHQPAATPKSTASVTAAEPRTPSPKKPLVKASSVSPVASRKEVDHTSPKSTV
jgi:hypothetical protein